jgi:hypothetical protein
MNFFNIIDNLMTENMNQLLSSESALYLENKVLYCVFVCMYDMLKKDMYIVVRVISW